MPFTAPMPYFMHVIPDQPPTRAMAQKDEGDAGTGLGVSGLLPDGHGGWVPLEGEVRHPTNCLLIARQFVANDHSTVTDLARLRG